MVAGVLYYRCILKYQQTAYRGVNHKLILDTLSLCPCPPITQTYRRRFPWRYCTQSVSCSVVILIAAGMHCVPRKRAGTTHIVCSLIDVGVLKCSIGSSSPARCKIGKIYTGGRIAGACGDKPLSVVYAINSSVDKSHVIAHPHIISGLLLQPSQRYIRHMRHNSVARIIIKTRRSIILHVPLRGTVCTCPAHIAEWSVILVTDILYTLAVGELIGQHITCNSNPRSCISYDIPFAWKARLA